MTITPRTTMIKNPKWRNWKTKLERNSTVSAIRMIQTFFLLALSLEIFPTISAKSIHMIKEVQSGSMHGSIEQEIDNICLTPGCVKAAGTVINKMNRSVDPCDDFYQFACGNFIEEADDSKEVQMVIGDIHESLKKIKFKIITEPIQPNDLKSIKMAKSLYKSCMDIDKIEEQGIEPLKKVWNSIGGWPLLEKDKWNQADFTWTNSVSKFKETGTPYPVFFIMGIRSDIKNNTRRMINIARPPPLILDEKILAKGFNETSVQETFIFMKEVIRLFGATVDDTTDNEIKEMLNFEIELAKIMPPIEDITNYEKKDNPINFVDLPKKYPSIPLQEILTELFNPISIHQDEVIIVHHPNYFSDLEILLSKTPKRVQANYLIWKFVFVSNSYWPESIRIKVIGKGIETRQDKCVDECWKFSAALDSLYVRKFVDENTKKNIIEMVNSIQEEMYKILSSVNWLDDETRKNAIDKLNSITSNLVYPEEQLDDKKLNDYYEKFEMNDTNFITALMSLNKFLVDQECSKLRQPINKTDWTSTGSIVEASAFYKPDQNSINIPAGILRKGIYSSDRPQYMNYGSIGYIIGHEITHGFDNIGSLFDKDGNMLDWWTEKAKKNFQEKNKCIIEQYDNYAVDEIGMKVNGIQTLGENIADNGGAKEAYNAYNTWTKLHGVEPRLPGLHEFTPQQMFWISIANTWCTKRTPESLKAWVITNTHSPERFRVIGPFSNIEDFSNDFNCPLGSNMNPVKKCQVW